MQPLLQWKRQPVCVFVALGTQHAMHMSYIVLWPAHSTTIFFQIIS